MTRVRRALMTAALTGGLVLTTATAALARGNAWT